MKKSEPQLSFVLLRGEISKLERSRRSHDFVLSQMQQRMTAATAIVAIAEGMTSSGLNLVNQLSNSDEDADWAEFELDGERIQGWFWLLPMKNGDKVEVVAEKTAENRYVAYAVKRDGDDIVAVYPHAVAGRRVGYRESLWSWFWLSLLSMLLLFVAFFWSGGIGIFRDDAVILTLAVGSVLAILMFGLMTFFHALRFTAIERLSEAIFGTFDWPDVEHIDLRKTSRANRRENALPNYGTRYFRYK